MRETVAERKAEARGAADQDEGSADAFGAGLPLGELRHVPQRQGRDRGTRAGHPHRRPPDGRGRCRAQPGGAAHTLAGARSRRRHVRAGPRRAAGTECHLRAHALAISIVVTRQVLAGRLDRLFPRDPSRELRADCTGADNHSFAGIGGASSREPRGKITLEFKVHFGALNRNCGKRGDVDGGADRQGRWRGGVALRGRGRSAAASSRSPSLEERARGWQTSPRTPFVIPQKPGYRDGKVSVLWERRQVDAIIY